MTLATIPHLGRSLAVAFALTLGSAAQAAAPAPDAVIRTTTDAIRADIAKNVDKYRKDKPAFYAMVDREIVPHFDTNYIAKVILGSHLKQATPEQVTQFEKAFKDMLVNGYADRMLEHYDGIEVEIKPARVESSGKRATVDTTIVRKDGKPPIPVTFSMRAVGDDWKVWDIKAENISLVLNFRTQIDAEIRKNGIPAVIQRLSSGQLQVEEPKVGTKP